MSYITGFWQIMIFLLLVLLVRGVYKFIKVKR